MSFVNIHDKN